MEDNGFALDACDLLSGTNIAGVSVAIKAGMFLIPKRSPPKNGLKKVNMLFMDRVP